MNNIELIDASFIKVAVNEMTGLINENKKCKRKTVIFGGKNNWSLYNKGKITEDQYKQNKLRSISMRGSTQDPKGNRKFELDIPNSQIIFKPNKNTKIYARIPKTKQDKTLLKLQRLCELGETYFTCKLNNNYIYITFDETILNENKYVPVKKRICAIDLNPNYISFVARDKDKILYKEIIGLQELNLQKNTNKKHHEDIEISKRLVNLAKHYRCEYFVYEKLEIESNDRGKGKIFNKICNTWRRNKIIDNINKRCNIVGIKTQEIIAQYSSFIGQIDNENEYDSIAAAIELSRRGLLFVRKYNYNETIDIKGQIIGIKNKLSEYLMDRWKKKLNINKNLITYKDLYDEIKKMRYSYRNLFQFNWFYFRLNSYKSYVYLYNL